MPNVILKVPKDKVVDEWGLPYDGSDEDQVEVLEDEIMDHTRWSVVHSLIVRIGDKFYQTSYSRGATESQDERPFEYDDEVEFVQVEQIEKVIKVWEPIQVSE